jgi:hypothetical protein
VNAAYEAASPAPLAGAAADVTEPAWWRIAARALLADPWRFGGLTLGLCIAYYAGLLAIMTARMSQIPNFGRAYDVFGAFALIWSSTPSRRDALSIMSDEPVFEIGYKMPEFGIAEWSLLVGVPNLFQVAGGAALLATFLLVSRAARRAGCPVRGPAAAAGASAGMLGLCSASLTWVVCCATPSWVVALSLLGVSLSVAQALGPFDLAFLAGGTLAALAAIALQARGIARSAATPRTAAAAYVARESA